MAINARAAARGRASGVERWAVALAERLPALRPDAYTVIHPPRGLAHGAGQAWEQTLLPIAARRTGAQTILSPANLAPLAWPRNVIVVHDAVVLSHPEWYSQAYRAWHGRLLPLLVRRATRVIAVSEFSRDEICEHTGRPAADIDVVGGGVGEAFRPGADPGPVGQRFGLDHPYVLAFGGGGPRKNVHALADAARMLAGRGVDLVVAGWSRGHHATSALVPGARTVGYVPDELLPGLYAGARAFVMPSLHEGFGLPCLEAMASGVPVVAGDRGALPQTCGDAALLVDPTRPAEIAAALDAVLSDDALAARLRRAGLARAGASTWDRALRAVDRVSFGAIPTL